MGLADYSMPRAPDQTGLAKAIMSIGDDFSSMGETAYKAKELSDRQLLQYELKLKEIAAKHNLDLAEIEARKQADIEKDREKEKIIADRAKEIRRRSGVDDGERPESDPMFATTVEDESGGHTGTDKEKYSKYRENQRRGYIMSEVFARKPEAADDAARGYRADWITGRMQDTGTDEGIRRGARAEKGGDRFEVKGDEKIDEFSDKGFLGQTDQGQGKIKRDAASANRDNAHAGLYGEQSKKVKAEAESGGKPTTLRDAVALVDSARKGVKDAVGQVISIKFKDNPNILSMSEEEREALVSDHPEVVAAKESRRVATDYMNEFLAKTKGGPSAEAKKAPYPDGTRLRKDGKIYVVRNGKPVLEGK